MHVFGEVLLDIICLYQACVSVCVCVCVCTRLCVRVCMCVIQFNVTFSGISVISQYLCAIDLVQEPCFKICNAALGLGTYQIV